MGRIEILFLLLLVSFATAQEIFVGFNVVGELKAEQTNRFFLNVTCEMESSEFMKGDLVEYKTYISYGNFTHVWRESKFIYDVPCPLQSNQVYSELIPAGFSFANVTYEARRFDMPKNLIPIKYIQVFNVVQPAVSSNQSLIGLQGDIVVGPKNPLDLQFNLFWVAVLVGLVALILLFFRSKIAYLLIILAIVMGLISWFFKV